MKKRIVHFKIAPPTSGVTFELAMPKGAQPLTVRTDSTAGREIRLYAEVDADAAYEKHLFYCVPNGYPYDDARATYVGTVVLGSAADIVLHFLHVGALPPAEGSATS